MARTNKAGTPVAVSCLPRYFLKDKVENASFKSAASGFISFPLTFSRTVSFGISLHENVGSKHFHLYSVKQLHMYAVYVLLVSFMAIIQATQPCEPGHHLCSPEGATSYESPVNWSSNGSILPVFYGALVNSPKHQPPDRYRPVEATIQEPYQSPYAAQRTHNACKSIVVPNGLSVLTQSGPIHNQSFPP
jgi:hypothetical protein